MVIYRMVAQQTSLPPETDTLIEQVAGEFVHRLFPSFRMPVQFDKTYYWLFLGRDWQRLRRLFGSYHLPLYHAASDLTPEPWRLSSPTFSRERKAQ